MADFSIEELEHTYQECTAGSYEPNLVIMLVSCLREIYMRDKDYRGWIEWKQHNLMKLGKLPKLPA